MKEAHTSRRGRGAGGRPGDDRADTQAGPNHGRHRQPAGDGDRNLSVRVEYAIVDGPEAAAWRSRQAAAIQALLAWVASQRQAGRSPDTRRELRTSIRDRFADLAGQLRRAEADHATLDQPATTRPADNPNLIDQLPQTQLHLPQAPHDLQRTLYDAFDLKITYNQKRHHATIESPSPQTPSTR